MSTGDDPPPYREPPELHVAHFLLCRGVWSNPAAFGSSLGIFGIYTHVEPPDGYRFPLRLDRVFVYFQFWGEVGEYEFRVRLLKVNATDDGDDEEHLGPNGEPREFPMPSGRSAAVSGLEYVEQVAFPVGPVPFREAGVYEFQLWADGVPEPLARERILARE